MRTISRIYIKKVGELASSLLNPFRKTTPKVLMLMYHRVVPTVGANPFHIEVVAERFEQQMQHLRRHYNVISMDEFVLQKHHGRLCSDRQVVITFDDGYVDNYRHALPILKRCNLPAIFYLTANYVSGDRLFWWDEVLDIVNAKSHIELGVVEYDISTDELKSRHIGNIASYFRNLSVADRESAFSSLHDRWMVNEEEYDANRPLSWQEASEMLSEGMLLGSHSCGHPSLSRIPEGEVVKEVLDARRMLEQKLGVAINHFSYPFDEQEVSAGKVMELPRRIVSESGMLSAVTTIHGCNTIDTDIYGLKRVYISDWDEATFGKVIRDAFSLSE